MKIAAAVSVALTVSVALAAPASAAPASEDEYVILYEHVSSQAEADELCAEPLRHHSPGTPCYVRPPRTHDVNVDEPGWLDRIYRSHPPTSVIGGAA